MSTLKVNNVTDLGDDAVITDGALVGAGKILQVVHIIKSDTQAGTLASGDNFTVTNYAPSITPLFSSSKLLHFVTISGGLEIGHSFFVTGGVSIAVGDAVGVRTQVPFGDSVGGTTNSPHTRTLVFVDTPGSTATLTYGLNMSNTRLDTRNFVVNRGTSDDNNAATGRTTSTWTIMEVAG